MEGKKRLDLFGIRKRSQQRWIEGTLYEVEHRQLPDAYFDLKKRRHRMHRSVFAKRQIFSSEEPLRHMKCP